MRKFVVTCMVLCSLLNARAQDECMSFFPNTPGAVLVGKTYDGQGRMVATTTYTIESSSEDQDGYDTQIAVLMTDSTNKVLDRGHMEVSCDDNVFMLKVKYSFLSPELLDLLSMNTQLIGDFMDYPATYNNDYPFTGNLKMEGGEYLLHSHTDNAELVKVRVFNRYHKSNEKITTPADTFEASKITYDFEVTRHNQSTYYKGTERYARDAGIVRSETRDENDNLVSYTELTSVTIPAAEL